MQVQDYSEKSIVVFGEKTRDIKEDLKALGAKFNMKLSVGPGWVIQKDKRSEVEKLIQNYENETPVSKKPAPKVSYKTRENVENMKMNDIDDPIELLKLANNKMDKILSLMEDFHEIKKKLNEFNIKKDKKVVKKEEKKEVEEEVEYEYEEEIEDVKRFKL